MTLAIPDMACLVCGTTLGPALEGERLPTGGTVFTSHGNYGSTVFDAARDAFLEIYVCDGCLKAARDRGVVIYARPRHVEMPIDRASWTGEPQ